MKRIDSEGRDVTSLPGLWSEEDKFQVYQLESAIERLRSWVKAYGEEKEQAFVNDIVRVLDAVTDLRADYNQLHEATRCILPLIATPFQSSVDFDLYNQAVSIVGDGRKLSP